MRGVAGRPESIRSASHGAREKVCPLRRGTGGLPPGSEGTGRCLPRIVPSGCAGSAAACIVSVEPATNDRRTEMMPEKKTRTTAAGRWISAWLIGTTAAAAIGCAKQGNEHPHAKPVVAVSILPQAWLVEQIADGHVEVLTVVRPGESPATYQPTDAQISGIIKAAVYFRIGVPFENGPWFEAIRAARGPRIVDLRRGVRLRRMSRAVDPEKPSPLERKHGRTEDVDQVHRHAGGEDPHIWLSPRLLKILARAVAAELARLDPAHRDEFNENLAALEARLDGTDATIRAALQPLRGRAFFVFHPAWGYFAEEYGLRQVAVELEGKEPSDRELTRLQQLARTEQVKVVFVQPQISGRSARAVAAAIGGRVERIDPLAADVPESLTRVAALLVESYR